MRLAATAIVAALLAVACAQPAARQTVASSLTQKIPKTQAEFEALRANRLDYARTLNLKLLDRKLESTVTVTGKDGTFLEILSPSMSRVMARDFMKDLERQKLLGMGFQMVMFSQGRDSVLALWTLDNDVLE